MITTAKAPFLICILAAVCGLFAARQTDKSRTGPAQGIGLRGILLGSAIALVLVLSLAARYGGGDDVDSDLLVGRVAGYVFGQVYAFSAWVTTGGWLVDHAAFGQYTLAGVFELFGIGARTGGMYTEIAIDDGAAESNVFTAFRGLIQDFYLPGAVAVMFALGLLVTFLAKSRNDSLGQPMAITGLLTAYLFLGWSPVISIFNYNSVVLAVGAAALALFASHAPVARSNP